MNLRTQTDASKLPKVSPEAAEWSVAFMVHQFPLISETFIANLSETIIPHVADFRILATGTELGPQPHHPVVARAGLLDRLHLSPNNGRIDPRQSAALAWQRPTKAHFLAALTAFDAVAPRHKAALTRMLIRQPAFDIVHCQFGYEGLAALRHRRFGTLKTRALISHLRGSDITRHVREAGKDVYDGLFEEAELLIANCEYFRQTAIGLGARPEKVVVVGSPIDTDWFSPPLHARPAYGDRPLRLVAVGRLVDKKGFEDAVHAMAHLGDLEAHLDIYGDGPLRQNLADLAGELGVGDRVTLHGAVTSNTILDALHRADIALAPSVRAADGDADAPVNTLKEAMATALPVIATEHGGIPELVEHGAHGFLVPERAPQVIAARIRDLVGLSANWAEMGAKGRAKVVANYGMRSVTEKTLEAYLLALSGKEDR